MLFVAALISVSLTVGLLGAGSWTKTLIHIIFLNFHNNTVRWKGKTKRKPVTSGDLHEDLCFLVLTKRTFF